MLIVHHLENSRSHRILWLLEELELPYEIKEYARDPKTMSAPGALRAIHPLGKAPLLEDNGRVFAESGAIIEYVLDTYGEGRLRPASGATRDYYRFWMHYAEGSAMPLFVMKLIMSELPQQGPFLAKPLLKAVGAAVTHGYIDKQLKTHLLFWEQILTYNSYFTGKEFSAADIQMSFALEAVAQGAAPRKLATPRSLELLARLQERPAYKRAIDRGGPLRMPSR